MGSLGVVDDQVGVEVGLHLLDGLVPLLAALDAEVLVEKPAVQALDEAVGLGPLDLGGAVFDVLGLEEEPVGVAVGPAAELPAVAHWEGQLVSGLTARGTHRELKRAVMAGVLQAVIEDRLFDLLRDPVGVQPPWARAGGRSARPR